jgi:hypothetical protein
MTISNNNMRMNQIRVFIMLNNQYSLTFAPVRDKP